MGCSEQERCIENSNLVNSLNPALVEEIISCCDELNRLSGQDFVEFDVECAPSAKACLGDSITCGRYSLRVNASEHLIESALGDSEFLSDLWISPRIVSTRLRKASKEQG